MTEEHIKNPEKMEAITSYEQLVSKDAMGALKLFCETYPENAKEVTRVAKKTVEIFADFAKECIGDPDRQCVFDAAMLSTFIDNKEKARFYGRDYFRNQANPSRRTSEILTDIWALREIVSEGRGIKSEPETQDALEDVPAEMFDDEPFKPKNAKEFAKITAGVEREAFLVSAAKSYVEAKNYETMSNADIITCLSDIESVYSPYLDVIGYEGFHSELDGIARRIRRAKSPQSEQKLRALQEVTDYMDTVMGKPPKRERFKKALEIFFTNDLATEKDDVVGFDSALGYISGEHSVFVGEVVGVILVPRDGGSHAVETKGNCRVKTYEKTADKKEKPKNRGQMPVDMSGLRLIVNNDLEAAVMIRYLINHVNNHNNISFCPAPSSKFAVQVKGTQDYMDTMATEANLHEMTEFDPPTPDNHYQISKVTVTIDVGDGLPPVPLEVQVITQLCQENSRYRKAAHIFYDIGFDQIGEKELDSAQYGLEAIHLWGAEPKKTGLRDRPANMTTQARGGELRQYVLQDDNMGV